MCSCSLVEVLTMWTAASTASTSRSRSSPSVRYLGSMRGGSHGLLDCNSTVPRDRGRSNTGRIDTASSGDVMDQLNGPVNAGATRLIVNLKDLTYISSAGLRSILVAAKMTKTLNGGMRLCEPNALVSKTLEVSGFDNLIKIDSLESQSLEAFRGDRPPAS